MGLTGSGLREGLSGKVCLVTGGAQGIGWAVALAFARAGARVHACDISERNLSQAGSSPARSGLAGSISLSRCDVGDVAQLTAWIDSIAISEGRIDILVNNAAYVDWRDFGTMGLEEALASMQVGYGATVAGTKAALPRMQAGGGGHIVNMGSSAGKVFVPGPSAAYAATKAAIEGFTRTLQLELADGPVKVTLVRLATVRGTQFFRESVPSRQLPRMADFMPVLEPSSVAEGILKAVLEGKATLDMPAFLPMVYLLYSVAPGLVRRLASLGSGARRDYSGTRANHAGL